MSAPVLHKQLWSQIQYLANRATKVSPSAASRSKVDGNSAPLNVPFTVTNLVFCTAFFLLNAAVVVIELLVREQDWAEYGLSATLVYPMEAFVSTSLLMVVLCFHLTAIEVLPRDAALCVVEIHAAKMLHFWGMPSQAVFLPLYLCSSPSPCHSPALLMTI